MYVKEAPTDPDAEVLRDADGDQFEKCFQLKKLYVTNLGIFGSERAAEAWVETRFRQFGRVVDMKVLTSSHGQIFGFVTYSDEESVVEAMNSVHRLGSSIVQTQRAKLWRESGSQGGYVINARKVFVGGIPNNCGLGEFRQYFSRFGRIEEVFMPTRGSVNQGFGFVTFVSTESVRSLFEEPNHFIRGKWLDIKVANPRRDTSPNFSSLLPRSHHDPSTLSQPGINPQLR